MTIHTISSLIVLILMPEKIDIIRCMGIMTGGAGKFLAWMSGIRNASNGMTFPGETKRHVFLRSFRAMAFNAKVRSMHTNHIRPL